ncbi:DUF4031 domain-containing protein [Massilia cavernae]|uniref:DUF4031 domain-containing protein n=1 Tax=Massilia cavernae TaxID=2320864 RepID=A0A418XH09_9BURK|nr:DUF4031 domain-containing protein [Massilia cavernae]RJG11715.1 DUF4031 domain-containing protein [Massilia cavernae]
MAVYVDDECIEWRGKVWCHMVADTPEELHIFAARIGLKRVWFQSQSNYPHYDITLSVRGRALQLGAILADRPTLLSCARELKRQIAVQQEVPAAQLTLVF